MKANNKKSVLFVCTGNSCRSQMAEGFARAMLPGGWRVYSAGTIAAGIHPMTTQVMAEAGVDISGQRSKSLGEVPQDEIGFVITLCGDARDRCPASLLSHPHEHWPIEDPIGARGEIRAIDAFREVRDEIKRRVETFVKLTGSRRDE